ncbi:MAG TPA: response regulator [Candidatus Limnocylindria bacterium]
MSGHRSVLVVEDDSSIGELIVELLRSEGYRTRHAGDGRAAIASLHEEQPLALIVDMGLPFVDGAEVARTSRRLYDGHVPIIVVTADGHAEAHARELGASGFLTKPFDVDELVSVVRRSLRGIESLHQDEIDARERHALEHDAARERRGSLRRQRST